MTASPITRRKLLTAVATIGISPAHAWGFAVQATSTRTPPPTFPTEQRWTAVAAQKLRTRQELAYRELGQRLGLGSDPMRVYRALTRERMPPEQIGSAKFWNTLGSAITPKERRTVEAQVAEYLAKYGTVQTPTPYEDPNLYAMLLEMSDSIEAALKSHNLPTPARLLLGTLPTGRTHAWTSPVPETKERVIIFERGLFDFVFQTSRLAASIFPPFDMRRQWFSAPVNINTALRARPNAVKRFNEILHAYVVLGDSRRISREVPETSRQPTANLLLRSAELFILAHEYGHVVTSHADDLGPVPPDNPSVRWNWDEEYGADLFGRTLMSAVMGTVPLSFWGTAHLFGCLEALDQCRSILATGSSDPRARPATHPPHLWRARQLQSGLREIRPGAEMEKAIELAEKIGSLWSRLWRLSEPHWLVMHKKGVRPSPIWS